MHETASKLLHGKVPYDIYSASSHEEGFHPRELLAPNLGQPAKGWQSERFCIFPQQLVVRFTVGECRLKKIQILSHHFKISTRLELYVGCKRISSASSEKSRYSNSSKQDVTQDGIRYVRLGFVSLGDNSNSGYKARELKSIPVDEEGEYLKIIFHQNYINSLNLYNQVGLVALTVVGEYDQTQIFSQGVGQQTKTIIGLDPLAPDHAPAAAEDSTADEFQVSSYQDQYLVKIMKSAIQAKKDAVRDENFKLANALKTLVELTRKASEEVSKLLLLKAKSIELEDYELAEDAKDDIDQIKDALASKINELGLKRTQDDRIIPLEQIEPVISKVPTHPPIQTPDTTMDLPKAALMERMRADSMEAARRREEEELIQQRKALEEEERKRESAALQQTELIEAVPETRLTDALPAISEPRPKRTKPAPVERADSIPILPNLSGYNLSKPDALDVGSGGSGLTALGEPEKLNDELTDKYGILIQVYGSFITRCLLSKQFKLREEAVEEVIQRVDDWCTNNRATKKSKKDLEKPPPDVVPRREKIRVDWTREIDAPEVDRETFIEATFVAVGRGLDDSRERAITLSLSLWELLTKTCVSREISKLLVFRQLDTLMPLLLLKSGHMNPRVKQACLELVLLLAKAYHIIPHSVIKYLLKPPKPTASPRYIIARLDALHLVLMKSGVDDMKQLENAGSGLTIKSAMTFTEPQLHNKTTEIREAAVKVIIDLCLLVDNDELIFSYLTNIKHQTLHIIQTRLELARHGKEIQNEKEGEKLSETVSSETLVATDTAIRSPGSIPPGLGTISSEEQLVKNLKNEIQDLKGIVQERKMLDKQPTSKKSNTKESTAISTAPLVNDSVTASVKPKTKVKPSPSAKLSETRDMKSNDPVATRTPKPPTPIELEQPLEVIHESKKDIPEERVRKTTAVPHNKPIKYAKKKPTAKRVSTAPAKKREDQDSLKMTLTEERLANSWNRTCIFCNEKSPDFTDENLDIHYWRDCPMLCSCPLCHLIVEIPVLTAHMHDECDNKKLVKQCSRCKECIMTAEFQSHVERQTCLPASIIPGVARCPLCHMDVPHGESGWKTHLLQNGCSRKKKDSDVGSETNLDLAYIENKSNSDETTTAVLKAAEPKMSKGKKKEDGISETNLNLAPSENVNQTTPAVLKPANGLKKPKSVIKSATK